jgi:hypothetical protein
MNKRPGQVRVTIETGYCSFCGRPRNLRREEHQLGTLVRSIVTCETCHRTLSSSVGVASAEPVAAEAPVAVEEPVETATPVKAKAPAKPNAAPAKPKAAPAKPKPAPAKKAAKKAAKPAARGGKPTSTATRRVTKRK